MKQFDQEQVRKIWQRVQSGAAYEPNAVVVSRENAAMDLRELIAREMVEKETFLHLSGKFSGKNAGVLRQMAKQAQSNAAILRGICAMTEGNPPAVRPPKPSAVPIAALLRRCYGQTLQILSEYEKRGSDSQFGGTFQKLAEQKQTHCRILLALLGSLPSPKNS